MMVSIPVHNKKNKNRKPDAFSAYVYRNWQAVIYFIIIKQVFMLWFMSLMQCHYSMAVLTVEEKLFIVTYKASDWDPRLILRMVTRAVCARRNCPAGKRIVWSRSNRNILLSSAIFVSQGGISFVWSLLEWLVPSNSTM